MDSYGCFRATPEDWDELTKSLDSQGSIVFGYSKDQTSAYVVMITESFTKLGVLPFGGNPDKSALVSLLHCGGSFWFDLRRENEIHPSYLQEKMSVSKVTSEEIAELLNEIRKRR